MKVPAIAVVVLSVAFAAQAATVVVLKGGKRLEASSTTQQGNYLIVRYADGRAESYPLGAVDQAATRAANAMPEKPAAPAKPVGPHSPFFEAQATAGAPATSLTDADVQHVAPPEETGEEGQGEKPSPGQVVILGYDKQPLEDGQWSVTANIANTGSEPVRGVVASIRLLDAKGGTLGTGTATHPDTLGPGEEASISTTLNAPGEPAQISFDLQWQTIRVVPRAAPAGEEGAAPKPPSAGETPAPEAEPGWNVPPGSSPLTVPSNPMAVPPLTTPPTAPQVPRSTPEEGGEAEAPPA